MLPLIIPSLIETGLIHHSHSELNRMIDNAEGVVQNIAQPMYTYAVGAYVTRIATVVAFFSYILTHAKDG